LQWPLTVLPRQAGRRDVPFSSLFLYDVYGFDPTVELKVKNTFIKHECLL
jgi:hypothetical protein